ncbi:hypothetical protein C8R45DRAFT_1088890 [Mycena sanguinolenta]|nr:hypothetical protein C8R45DRAFT_1088890 [Mycena sanguinolenta]
MKFIAALSAFVAAAVAQTFTTNAEMFVPEGGRGVCGVGINNTDFAASIQTSLFSVALCNLSVTVTAANGLSVTATIMDECIGCRDDKIELTPVAFAVIGGSADVQGVPVTYSLPA